MAKERRDINGEDGIYVLYIIAIVAALTIFGMSNV